MKYELVLATTFLEYSASLIEIVLNGFQKKTQKTPKTEIDRALRLKKEYYEDKE
jgi:phage-related protein